MAHQPSSDDVPAPFTPRFWEEVNQGPLEEAYERRLHDPTNWTRLATMPLIVGILVGLLFAYVNVFAVLAVGFTVGGSWYLSYFVGMLLRWRPGLINYVGGASTGASQHVIGLAFVVPALFFVSELGDGPGAISSDQIPSWPQLAAIALAGAAFGLMFFQLYRRLWVVERPLQYPGGFESAMELMALSAAADTDRRDARRSIFAVIIGAAVAALIVFLRDLTIVTGADGSRSSVLDAAFGSDLYRFGFFPDTWVFRGAYNGVFYLSPFMLGIGWFVRRRVAGIMVLGSLLTTLLVYLDPSAVDGFSAFLVWNGNARTLGAGAIVGAGAVGLFRLRSTLWDGVQTVLRGSARADDETVIDGTNPAVPWLWLKVGFPFAALVAFTGFWLAGFGLAVSALLVAAGILLIGFLGLVGVKVTGETAVQAVSPLTLVALLVLVGLFKGLGLSTTEITLFALSGAALFATGLVASTDIFLDVKVGHYLGNPPRRQAIAQTLGMIPGLIIGAATVLFFARGIADGSITGLGAPIGRAYAGIASAVISNEIWWTGFLIAMGIGGFVEWATRLGTAFGLGMVLQSAIPLTIFGGALLRDLYEARTHRATGPDLAFSVGAPAGLFVGDALATLAVFGLHQWVL